MAQTVTNFFFFANRRRHTRSDRDWSSDVCSSDLPAVIVTQAAAQALFPRENALTKGIVYCLAERVLAREQSLCGGLSHDDRRHKAAVGMGERRQIGRAAWRERKWISAGAGSLKKK